MTETRGQSARRRREALRLTRDDVAREAGVSPATLQTYENDDRENQRTEPQILAALERLEARVQAPRDIRSGGNNPQRRLVETVMEEADLAEVRVRDLNGVMIVSFFARPRGVTDEQYDEAIKRLREEGND